MKEEYRERLIEEESKEKLLKEIDSEINKLMLAVQRYANSVCSICFRE